MSNRVIVRRTIRLRKVPWSLAMRCHTRRWWGNVFFYFYGWKRHIEGVGNWHYTCDFGFEEHPETYYEGVNSKGFYKVFSMNKVLYKHVSLIDMIRIYWLILFSRKVKNDKEEGKPS